MVAACEIGKFYLAEALRLAGHQELDPETLAVSDLAKWLTGWPHDLIAPWLIQRYAPRPLRRNATGTRKLVEALQAAGVLQLVGPGEIDGQRYRETYRINRSSGGVA